MAEVDVKFEMGPLIRQMQKYEQRTKNLPMPLVANSLINKVDEMFQTQGSAGTKGAWKPLKESTLKRHPRRVGGKLLQASGATANIQVAKIEGYSVTVLSPTGYAGFHVTGTKHMIDRDYFAIKFGEFFEEVGDVLLQEYQR